MRVIRTPDTAMMQAFLNAGFSNPQAKLLDIAGEAWRRWSTPNGEGARLSYVMNALRQAPQSDDDEKQFYNLAFELINWWNPVLLRQAACWLLEQAEEEIRSQRPKLKEVNNTGSQPVGGGHGGDATRSGLAPATPSRDDARAQPLRRSEPALNEPTPMRPAPAAPTLKKMADAQVERMKSRLATAIKLSRLDTFKIWGMPLGDCHVSQVRGWLEQREKDFVTAKREMRESGLDVRFIARVISGLTGDKVIRDYLKPDEVDKIYAEAEEEYAAV